MLTTTNSDAKPLKAALRIGGATALGFLALMAVWASIGAAAAEDSPVAARPARSGVVALQAPDAGAEWRPWGVQLAASFTESRALATYRGLQKRYPSLLGGRAPVMVRKPNPSFGPRPMIHVRIAASSREAADDLCQRLRAQGGACAVLRN